MAIRIWCILLLLGVLTFPCSAQEEFEGFPYDPEGATVTTDKEILQQNKWTIGYPKDGIWISNKFSGARMNGFQKISSGHYRVDIKPEIHPINNSPWYAFKIRSDTSRIIKLELAYEHGDHRYVPKISTNGTQWGEIQSANYALEGETATLILSVDRQPLWISAQELVTPASFTHWAQSLTRHSSVSLDTVGYSHDGQPIQKILISSVPENKQRGVLVVTGRQHPPEVTGALAAHTFIEELVSEHPVAKEFRRHFEVWAYPLINPDGVQRGHWRQNAVGVDLNRDWKNFNQPETRSIRDDLLPLKKDTLRRVYYGIDFHSTNDNILYPIERDISTFPKGFTYQWIDSLSKKLQDFTFTVEPFDTQSPITKNWIYHTFGADAVTYELDDTIERSLLHNISRQSARTIMQQLLNEKTDHTPRISEER